MVPLGKLRQRLERLDRRLQPEPRPAPTTYGESVRRIAPIVAGGLVLLVIGIWLSQLTPNPLPWTGVLYILPVKLLAAGVAAFLAVRRR